MESREFVFTDQDFFRIRDTVGKIAGICLPDNKRELVYSRLSRRLRALHLRSFSEYCERIEQGDSEELVEMVNAITTNLTSFFREMHHFEYLERELLPDLMRRRAVQKRLRIWSAGCSTGEEPYSIAMVVREIVPTNWDTKILATDLDTHVLETARNGVYDASRIESVSAERRQRWFQRGSGEQASKVRVSADLQALITFRQLNLMESWPMKGPFDVIFCRNVVIYFDKPTQQVLFDRYANLLDTQGYLFVGHSETLHRVTDRFVPIGKTIYRKA